jgi:hypothetical protein
MEESPHSPCNCKWQLVSGTHKFRSTILLRSRVHCPSSNLYLVCKPVGASDEFMFFRIVFQQQGQYISKWDTVAQSVKCPGMDWTPLFNFSGVLPPRLLPLHSEFIQNSCGVSEIETTAKYRSVIFFSCRGGMHDFVPGSNHTLHQAWDSMCNV